MLAVRWFVFALAVAPALWAVPPSYSASSIVNAATGLAGDYAPNGIVTIYGTDLAYSAQSANSGTGVLPMRLAEVTVSLGGVPVNLFYVSPNQINFLVPANFVAGIKNLSVIREGFAGPAIPLSIKDSAPGFFTTTDGAVIAAHVDGTLCTADSPAIPEEIVVLYAAGLGRTNPESISGKPSISAAPLLMMSQVAILLSGSLIDPSRILYAGITPGFAGLYQINLRVPVTTVENPEIRVFIGQQGSPSYLKLPMRLQ